MTTQVLLHGENMLAYGEHMLACGEPTVTTEQGSIYSHVFHPPPAFIL